MKLNSKYAALLLLLAGALAGFAQDAPQNGQPRFYREGNAWVEETQGTLAAAHNLRVDVAVGTVHIDGGAQDHISYTLKAKVFGESEDSGRRLLERMRLNARNQGDTAVLESASQSMARRSSADLWITVPRDLAMARVTTRGGGIAARNINGQLMALTNGGGIDLDGVGGADVSTMGGDITVGNASADLRLRTNGGRIRVNNARARLSAATLGGDLVIGNVHGAALVETNGGSIRVNRTDGDLHATTLGGNLEIGDIGGSAVLVTNGGNVRANSIGGPVDASTHGGSIELGRVMGAVRARTDAGDIRAEIASGKVGDSDLETQVGEIVIVLPANLACSVRAAVEVSTGQRIVSDFPELKVTSQGGDYGPKQWYAVGNLNGGGPTVRLRTNVGEIEIRRTAAH